MSKPNSNLNQTLDLMIGVIPTVIIYGNFIFAGLFFGIKDMISMSNPLDEIFLISLGGFLGLLGLVLSFGKLLNKYYLLFTSVLIIFGIITTSYVIFSLYTELDSPDSLYEKILMIPLFGSLIVGIKRFYLCIVKK